MENFSVVAWRIYPPGRKSGAKWPSRECMRWVPWPTHLYQVFLLLARKDEKFVAFSSHTHTHTHNSLDLMNKSMFIFFQRIWTRKLGVAEIVTFLVSCFILVKMNRNGFGKWPHDAKRMLIKSWRQITVSFERLNFSVGWVYFLNGLPTYVSYLMPKPSL